MRLDPDMYYLPAHCQSLKHEQRSKVSKNFSRAVENFSKKTIGVRPGVANHNDFSVVYHPPPRVYQGRCMKPLLVVATHHYICDGLWVLRY